MSAKRQVLTALGWLPAALLLAALSWQVRAAGGLLDIDLYWADAVGALRSDALTTAMRALHSVQGKLVAAVIVLWAAALWWRRRWPSLCLLALMVPGGLLVNSGLKLLVERPRPMLRTLVGAHGFSYPSGHAAAITLFCGWLVIQTFIATPRWRWRAASIAAAAAVIGLVAFSRVYLGVHNATDVVAAVLLGVAWLGLCLSVRHWLPQPPR